MAYKRLSKSAINKYLNGALDAAVEMSVFMAKLKEAARVHNGGSGLQLEGAVEGGKYSMTGTNDGDATTFTRKNHLERYNIPWAEYRINDFVTEGERLQNRGKESLVDTQKKNLRKMRADFIEELSNAALNTDYNAITAYNALGGCASYEAGSYSSGKEAAASDTYAGLSCTASASTDIDGQVADFWTPTLVAWNKDVWGNSSANVSDNILDAMRYGYVEGCKGKGKDNKLDMAVLSRTDWFNFLSKYEAVNQFYTRGKQPAKADLGFEGVSYYGLDVFFDEDMTSGTGRMLNTDRVDLHLLNEGSDMFSVHEDFEISRVADVNLIVWRGQLIWQPKFQVKLGSY